MAADEGSSFRQPEGDPGGLSAIGTRLATAAKDAHAHAGRVRAERAGMLRAWTGPAGEANAAELDRVATFIAEEADKIAAGGRAFTTYATALAEAQKEVARIEADAVEVRAQARAQATESARQHTAGRPFFYREYLEGYLHTGLAPLRQRYEAALDKVRQAAVTTAAELRALVPPDPRPGGIGGSPEGQRTVSVLVNSRLQTAAAGDAAGYWAKRIDKYQEDGEPMPEEWLDQLSTEIERNPWFAADLAASIGVGMSFLIPKERGDLGDVEYEKKSTQLGIRLLDKATGPDAPAPLAPGTAAVMINPWDD